MLIVAVCGQPFASVTRYVYVPAGTLVVGGLLPEIV